VEKRYYTPIRCQSVGPINQQRHESTWLNSESATVISFTGIKNISTRVLGAQLESCIQH